MARNIWNCAKTGEITALAELLDRGHDINKLDKLGLTALQWTAKEDQVEAARLLIERGADLNIQDEEGQTALHWAVGKESYEIVKLLVDNMCDLDRQDKFMHTALHRAAASGQFEVAKLLINRGASVELKNLNGWIVLHVACHYYYKQIVQLLVEGRNVNFPTKDGWTPLHFCSSQGNIDLVKLLIKHGANVNAQTKDGSTPLHLAAKEGRSLVVECLLRNGGDVQLRNAKGKPAQGTSADIQSLLALKFPPPQEIGAHVFGEGLEKAQIDKPNLFTIKLRSIGNQLDEPVVTFTECSSGLVFTFGVQVIDHRNGGYTVTYHPPLATARPGKYRIDVKFGLEPVTGSPFVCDLSRELKSSNRETLNSQNVPEEVRKLLEENELLKSELLKREVQHQADIKRLAEENEMLKENLREVEQEEMDLRQKLESLEKQCSDHENELLQAATWKCSLCNTNPRNTMLMPCLHFLYCRGCLDGKSKCPYCDQALCGFVKIKMS